LQDLRLRPGRPPRGGTRGDGSEEGGEGDKKGKRLEKKGQNRAETEVVLKGHGSTGAATFGT